MKQTDTAGKGHSLGLKETADLRVPDGSRSLHLSAGDRGPAL
ncbi:MAG: hypothetical protein ACFB0G_08000 [Leptolyngbyaceae cyanobacterium]